MNRSTLILPALFLFLASRDLPAQFARPNKSGVTPNVISLPSGPGSIEGLGESFQPNINNGTGKQSVSIQVPPGTNGHAPQLSLTYEGGVGNGCLGFGWQFPQAYVQRQTDQGVPRYIDLPDGIDNDLDGVIDNIEEVDRFINEIREELIPVANGETTDYFCRIEGPFTRYRRVADYWEGRLPNGTRMVFGETAAARITDPSDASRVFRWLLEKRIDTNGNEIRYRYASALGETNLAQKYLVAIEYGAGSAPWGGHFHYVAFDYEDREDWFEVCRGTFPLRTGRRLREIRVGTQGTDLSALGHLAGDFNRDGTEDYLNRSYRIDYHPDLFVSLLRTVTLTGADGTTPLPTLTYDYTICREAPEIDVSEGVVYSINEPSVVFDDDRVDYIDLNGDALPDLLRTGATHQVYVNGGETTDEESGLPAIRWMEPEDVMPSQGVNPWNLSFQDDEVGSVDMNGDGLSDLCQTTLIQSVYYQNRPGGPATSTWGSRVIMEATDIVPPSPGTSRGQVRVMDVDFNKRIDVITSSGVAGSTDYLIWFNLGGDIYSKRATVSPSQGYDFGDRNVKLADLNGDRMLDIAQIRPTEVRFTISLGRGQFMEEEAMPIPELSLSVDQVAQATLRDVNGDGAADLIVVRPVPQEIWYWPNRGNRDFGDRIRLTGVPAAFASDSAIRWADINGNGSIDIIVGDSGAAPGERMRTIDLGRLTGCVPRAFLMNHISNGLGRREEVIYTTSTEYVLADGTDETTGQYTFNWPHLLPFALTVIKEIRTSDSLGDTYLERFRYHDGYYDPEEKQFRGFARVEQLSIGDATAPTRVQRSYFDIGKEAEVLKGRLLRLTTEDEAGGVFFDESVDWQTRQLYPGIDRREVVYAYAGSRRRDFLEQGRGTPRQIYAEFEYDNYGNRIAERNYGIVEGDNRTAFNDERFTNTAFALNLDQWLVNLPYQVEVSDGAGQIVNRTRIYYDDEGFSGANGGTLTRGNKTLVRKWIDPVADAFIQAERYRFDAYGNATRRYDPLYRADGQGHWTEVTYDSAFQTYAERETLHVDGAVGTLEARANYDPGFGTLLEYVDFNGNVTSHRYDALARIIQVVKPYDSPASPTTEYEYQLAQATGDGGLINWVETRHRERVGGGQILSREFVDGLGRSRLTKHEDEKPGTFIAKASTTFNARGKTHKVFNPHTSDNFAFENPSSDVPALEQRYDALLRPSSRVNQDGSSTETIYLPFIAQSFDENDRDPESTHFGTPVEHHRDGLGRLIKFVEIVKLDDAGRPTGTMARWETVFHHRADDRLLSFTDSQNNRKEMQYDGLGRMILMDDPDRGIIRRVYDDASNVVETTDHKGQVIRYTYDGVNRTLSEDFLDEGSPISFNHEFNPDQPVSETNRPDVALFYDVPINDLDTGHGNGDVVTAANVRGQLATVWDLTGETHISYDARGRVVWQVKRIRDSELVSPLVSYQTAFAYDSLDRMTAVTYPDGDGVTYVYNDRGLLESIIGGPGGHIISALDYTPWDAIDLATYGNGVSTQYRYDQRLRMSHLHTGLALSPPYLDYTYDFDAVNNLTAIVDNRDLAGEPEAATRSNSQRFRFDDLYRLTEVSYSGVPADGGSGAIAYHYDRIGNMIEKTSNIVHSENGVSITHLGSMHYGGPGGAANRVGRGDSPAGPHAFTAIGDDAERVFTYDRNGNMTQIDGLTCAWDFKDRMVTSDNAAMHARYVYDYNDRRVVKEVSRADGSPRETTYYVNQYFEVRPGEPAIKYVWDSAGAHRIARVTGSLSHGDAPRNQRLRLYDGWNQVALTVEGAEAQLDPALHPDVDEVRWWNDASQSWGPFSGENISPAEPLWVRASENVLLSLSGTHRESAPLEWAAGQPTFVVHPGGPEILVSRWPAEATLWWYDVQNQRWRARFAGLLAVASDPFPDALRTGEVLLIESPTAGQLDPNPSPEHEVRFYHKDHLGSSNVISDASGNRFEESLHYPFGGVRRHDTPRETKPEAYGFTQKEKDAETGLHYFEERYLVSSLGRFNRVDPLLGDFDSPDFLLPPESGSASVAARLAGRTNPYAYANNMPLNRIDPSGLLDIAIGIVGQIAPGVGVSGGWGLVLDTDDWTLGTYGTAPRRGRESGLPGVGLTAGAGIELGIYDEIEGDATDVSANIGPVGGSLNFTGDGQQFNGVAISLGVGAPLGAGAFYTNTVSDRSPILRPIEEPEDASWEMWVDEVDQVAEACWDDEAGSSIEPPPEEEENEP